MKTGGRWDFDNGKGAVLKALYYLDLNEVTNLFIMKEITLPPVINFIKA